MEPQDYTDYHRKNNRAQINADGQDFVVIARDKVPWQSQLLSW